jgi:hypothetical protein
MHVSSLLVLILAFAIVAALCTTAFPILYAFFPWRSTLLGKMLMLQAVAFALAMDGTVIFNLWMPSLNVGVVIEVIVFGLIAISTAALTALMWKANRSNRKLKKEEKHGRIHREDDAGPLAQREDV